MKLSNHLFFSLAFLFATNAHAWDWEIKKLEDWGITRANGIEELVTSSSGFNVKLDGTLQVMPGDCHLKLGDTLKDFLIKGTCSNDEKNVTIELTQTSKEDFTTKVIDPSKLPEGSRFFFVLQPFRTGQTTIPAKKEERQIKKQERDLPSEVKRKN